MGKLFISVAFQLIKEEGMMKTENNHLATVRAVVVSSGRLQWRLRLMDGRLIKNRNISPQMPISIKGGNGSFIWEQPDRHQHD